MEDRVARISAALQGPLNEEILSDLESIARDDPYGSAGVSAPLPFYVHSIWSLAREIRRLRGIPPGPSEGTRVTIEEQADTHDRILQGSLGEDVLRTMERVANSWNVKYSQAQHGAPDCPLWAAFVGSASRECRRLRTLARSPDAGPCEECSGRLRRYTDAAGTVDFCDTNRNHNWRVTDGG